MKFWEVGLCITIFNLRSMCDVPFSLGVVVHFALDNCNSVIAGLRKFQGG